MRRLLFLLAIMAAFITVSRAEEFIVGEIRGSGSTTTGIFKVQDKWEVRWNARKVVSVAVMASDGTIVAGAAGVLRGSLFVPRGGRYYFKILDGTDGIAARDHPAGAPDSSDPAFAWHVQIVELGASVASSQALTVYTPYFMMPDAALTPAPPPPIEPLPPLPTPAEIHALVVIKGDGGQGRGFLLKSPEGTFVATHLSLLANNPNVQVLTDTGVIIPTLALKAASSRDIALFVIKDDNYSYFTEATDPHSDVAVEDRLYLPSSSQGTIVNQLARVLNLTPDRIEFADLGRNNFLLPSPFGAIAPMERGQALSNPANVGMPLINLKSGQALGLFTAAKRIDLTEAIARAWPSNPAPGAEEIVPYYGLRLTGTDKWESVDPQRFLAETQLLHQFHLNTRSLDSYLNGRKYSRENGPPDNKFFATNSKIQNANDAYKHLANGADFNQQMEASRELDSALAGIADDDLAAMQPSSFYLCNQAGVQEELAYRKAIRSELDDLGNNLVHLDGIARTR